LVFFAVIGGSLLAASLLVALLVGGQITGPKVAFKRLATNNCALTGSPKVPGTILG
jgi:hypothetical protein